MGLFSKQTKQADQQGFPELAEDIRKNGTLPEQKLIAVKGNARNYRCWWDGTQWVQDGFQSQHCKNAKKR